jgi:hypothetical protein
MSNASFGKPAPKWSQDEAIAFECAREAISHLMAIYTARIAAQEVQRAPDDEDLAALQAERSRLARERAGLHVSSHVEIARIRAEYGAAVREWNSSSEFPTLSSPRTAPD